MANENEKVYVTVTQQSDHETTPDQGTEEEHAASGSDDKVPEDTCPEATRVIDFGLVGQPRCIWSGTLKWAEKMWTPKEDRIMKISSKCHMASTVLEDGTTEICGDTWPADLEITYIPKQLVDHFHVALLPDSRHVVFIPDINWAFVHVLRVIRNGNVFLLYVGSTKTFVVISEERGRIVGYSPPDGERFLNQVRQCVDSSRGPFQWDRFAARHRFGVPRGLSNFMTPRFGFSFNYPTYGLPVRPNMPLLRPNTFPLCTPLFSTSWANITPVVNVSPCATHTRKSVSATNTSNPCSSAANATNTSSKTNTSGSSVSAQSTTSSSASATTTSNPVSTTRVSDSPLLPTPASHSPASTSATNASCSSPSVTNLASSSASTTTASNSTPTTSTTNSASSTNASHSSTSGTNIRIVFLGNSSDNDTDECVVIQSGLPRPPRHNLRSFLFKASDKN